MRITATIYSSQKAKLCEIFGVLSNQRLTRCPIVRPPLAKHIWVCALILRSEKDKTLARVDSMVGLQRNQ